jgi:hypothetical protein
MSAPPVSPAPQDLRARRRHRIVSIRKRVAALSMAAFVGLFSGIYIQMADGHDPVLDSKARVAASRAHKAAAARSSSATGSSNGSSGSSSATGSSGSSSGIGSGDGSSGSASSGSSDGRSSSGSSPGAVTTSQS